ncbi:hypothetical protein KUTeg_020771 [Tegillarca granosa]|uniref:Uncharacterized protein n=1 Tax=Tegillarca granosa TaxID=220873 RepID=A0ABQ9EBD2_TEGGR|nr:hypothetical protein KUTeg_020771 [Tegillarca granosa]
MLQIETKCALGLQHWGPRELEINEVFYLKHEPDNNYDSNAVALCFAKEKRQAKAFLQRRDAVIIAEIFINNMVYGNFYLKLKAAAEKFRKKVVRCKGAMLLFSSIEMPPKKRNEWSKIVMAKALSAVKIEGLSVRLSVANYGLPKSSLGDRLSGRVREEAINGKAPLLSPNDEKLLKETAEHRADLGIAFSKMNFFRAAGALAKKEGYPSKKEFHLKSGGPSSKREKMVPL